MPKIFLTFNTCQLNFYLHVYTGELGAHGRKVWLQVITEETWLTQIFDELNTGCDAHSVDAAMNGHKAVSTDVNVRVSY